MRKKKIRFFSKLRHKYRLIIYNDNTFEEVLHFRLSRLNVGMVLVLGSLMIIIFTTFVIAYTPLREYIPGYPDAEVLQKAKNNQLFIDSITEKLIVQQKYLNNLKHLILYNEPINIQTITRIDTTKKYKNLNLDPSSEDSAFRRKIEQEEKYSITTDKTLHSLFVQNHYFTPVKGVVVNKFNRTTKHYGVDIVTKAKDMVYCILDGHIVYAGYTVQAGYMVIIQHKENIVSLYKHLERVFVAISDKVSAGTPIGIVGNTGELTTGPHLHFEIWYKGQPINPENVMNF